MDINTALFSHFCPDKDPTLTASIFRPFRDVRALGPQEIVYPLSKSSNTSALGPDQILYGIRQEVNKVIPSLQLALLGPLLSYGFHATSLKEAQGSSCPFLESLTAPLPPRFRLLASGKRSPRSWKG